MVSRRTRFCCAVLSIVGLTVSLSGCHAWTRPQGAVRDSAGKPISDANVTLKFGSTSQQIRTDKEGHYTVQVSQPPWKVDCNLTVSKAGFAPYEKQLKGPGIYKDLDVVLEPVAADSSSFQKANTLQGIARA